MKRLALIGVFLLTSGAACPRPVPPPVVPVEPADTTCETQGALHDMVVNDVVNGLQDGTGIESAVRRYTPAVVRCVVQELADDVYSAPKLVARARAWLAANGGN